MSPSGGGGVLGERHGVAPPWLEFWQRHHGDGPRVLGPGPAALHAPLLALPRAAGLRQRPPEHGRAVSPG